MDGAVALEVGFTVAPNGTGFVANSTFMPGVTAEMFDWWFGWHSVGPDLRYKIWDKEDHYYARAMNPDYVLDPAVPNREKTWGGHPRYPGGHRPGAGSPEADLPQAPSDLGYDMAKIGTPPAPLWSVPPGVSQVAAVMTHKAVEEPGGIWLKSHFWMGYGMDEQGRLVKLPRREPLFRRWPPALFGHNIKNLPIWPPSSRSCTPRRRITGERLRCAR